MVDPVELAASSAFAGLLAPIGPAPAGVVVAERVGLGLAIVEPRLGQTQALIARVAAQYGVTPPHGARRAASGGIAFLGIGPNRWLAVAEANGANFADGLARALDGVGSAIAQTDGLGVLRISRARARDAFAKGLPIDLDPRAFALDDVAASIVAHVGVTLWRAGEDVYDVALPRSLAASFWHWLAESAAEFGLAVEAHG